MIKELLKVYYGINSSEVSPITGGAGANTYLVADGQIKYILKNPHVSEINNPKAEIDLCGYLLKSGFHVSEYIKNLEGNYLTIVDDELYHMQKFVEGKMFEYNTAPKWLMKEMGRKLGEIHLLLADYQKLPVGSGQGFFSFMTPERVMESYLNSLEIAKKNKDELIIGDLEFRIELVRRFPKFDINVKDYTCKNTHGDYNLNQIICSDIDINSVIDWTSACIHPVSWEIMRSFVYAAPSAVDGSINIDDLIDYIEGYEEFSELNKFDIVYMARLFFYQISVCDYYGQYYGSKEEGRNLFLKQGKFSTKLMKWFDCNLLALEEKLEEYYDRF